jgi:hypothetical protein
VGGALEVLGAADLPWAPWLACSAAAAICGQFKASQPALARLLLAARN